MAKCIVLHALEMYTEDRTPLLHEILQGDPDLLAVVGVDAEAWEQAMDALCVQLDETGKKPGAFCNTTAHDAESLDAVITFAEQWCAYKGWPKTEVQVIVA
jgi:hypothetical protein